MTQILSDQFGYTGTDEQFPRNIFLLLDWLTLRTLWLTTWFLSCVPIFKNRTKPDLINELCQKLQGEWKYYGKKPKFSYIGTYTFEDKTCEK